MGPASCRVIMTRWKFSVGLNEEIFSTRRPGSRHVDGLGFAVVLMEGIDENLGVDDGVVDLVGPSVAVITDDDGDTEFWALSGTLGSRVISIVATAASVYVVVVS